ncbi:tyrosine-protein phosphatase non-receptor type 13-like isoform X2 [Bacillus rossius redtenbacheri]
MWRPRRSTVTLADVVELRGEAGLSEPELWALLCQAAQALQDHFLSGGDEACPPPGTAPCRLHITSRGRVALDLSPGPAGDPHAAPEPPPPRGAAADTADSIEKMWMYSLGSTLLASRASPGRSLQAALARMTHPDPRRRASLMDLLDVIADYCHTSSQSKPFTHIVMDLYSEVLGKSSQCLPDNASSTLSPVTGQEHRRSNSYPKPKRQEISSPCRDNSSSIFKSSSLNSKDLPTRRHPVQRAASRLYRATSFLDSRAKYCTPRTYIGPEFIVRAANPSKIIHISRVKVAHKRRVLVIMLSGQKLDISCNGNSTTAKELFEVVVQSEGLEENFMLGLAVLLAGDFVFLPPDTKLCKVAPAGWSRPELKRTSGVPSCAFTVYVRVRLFLPSLRGIRRWEVKHALYLQLRRCMLEQHEDCALEEAAVLAGLALQAEFGDHNEQEHGCGDYFLLEHYVAEGAVPRGREASVRALLQGQHARWRGLDPGRAEEAFVARLQRSARYGSHFHAARLVNKEGPDSPVWLVVSGEGVSVCSRHSESRQRTLREHFTWKNIQKLSFSKSCFFLQSAAGGLTRLKLRMDDRKSYFAFHLASLHHQFFLKLKVELISLQALSTEFGVPLKRSPERERLFRVEDGQPSRVPVLDKWQYGLFTPPKHRAGTPLEETQNKENEQPNGRPAVPLLRSNREWDRDASLSLRHVAGEVSKPAVAAEAITPRRARVKMGTRAFTSSQQHLFLPTDASWKICNITTEKGTKVLPETTVKKSPLSDAYVIN